MDIERLKELKEELDELLRCPMSVWNGSKYEDKNELTDAGKYVLALIDTEIARQSVTSAEVAEAIKEFEFALDEDFVVNGIINVFSEYQFKVETIDLAITALQAYQPTTRKDRTVEEVAISKTETTSARALSCWYCTEIEKHGVVAVKTVLDKAGRKLDAYETPYNYCPNCGKFVKEIEHV